MKIAVFGNIFQTEKTNQIKILFDELYKYQAEIIIDEEYYNFLILKTGFKPTVAEFVNSDNFTADIALSVGGDGTFLKTAEKVGRKNIPILGFNTGRLGFLADVSGSQIELAIKELFNHSYRVEERAILRVISSAAPDDIYPYALNEIAVLKQDTSSMITIHAYLNDDYLNSYEADGLIIATPTGSTAYSLSVGGPILEPEAKNFVISPIAPHSLNARPLVISNDRKIMLRVTSRSNNYLIALDGRSYILSDSHCIHIEMADFTTKIVKRHNHTFFDTLRNKLMWGVDRRS